VHCTTAEQVYGSEASYGIIIGPNDLDMEDLLKPPDLPKALLPPEDHQGRKGLIAGQF
jgi:hypothetical protein